MQDLTREEIRERFEFAKDFNTLFDVLEYALSRNVDDPELYKVLFWNKSLSPDEVALFAEQVNKQFPNRAYENYIWLADISALVLASDDNFDRALEYYQKAAKANPTAEEPYIKAVLCYDPDIKIPPIQHLIDFLKAGLSTLPKKKKLYSRLSYLYEQIGNDEMTEYYRHLAEREPD